MSVCNRLYDTNFYQTDCNRLYDLSIRLLYVRSVTDCKSTEKQKQGQEEEKKDAYCSLQTVTNCNMLWFVNFDTFCNRLYYNEKWSEALHSVTVCSVMLSTVCNRL